jgi:uncharacterized protein (TIGR02099 family)
LPGWALRGAGVALAAAYLLLAIAVLLLRYSVLPNVENYRGEVERRLSESLQLPVSIRAIEAHWEGLRPYLGLHGFELADAAGRPALRFERVDTELSWSSLLHLDLRLHRLDIAAPELTVRRSADGRISVGGIELRPDEGGSGFGDWLIRQGSVAIRDARIVWEDARRAAPPLVLEHVDLRLDNDGARHRIGLTAQPPAGLATRIDLRADLRGRDLQRPEQWRGEVYASLEYADLAVWRTWVDYPIEVSRGSGGVRLWARLADRGIDALTADIALADVRARLAPELPVLDLARLEGRLTARVPGSGFEFGTRALSLQTLDGLHLAPTDLQLRWQPAQGRQAAQGDLTAATLDLDALARLAAHLPLEAGIREKLATLAPRGRVADLKLNWSGDEEKLLSYAYRGRLEAVALNALGALPGFDGLSGSVVGTEQGGSANLIGRDATVTLPAVFAEPTLALRELNAQAAWTMHGAEVAVDIQNLSFNNEDAAGVASGRYRYVPGKAGRADITARLTRGEGPAVWRYMPLTVNPRVREFLRGGILGGRADDARLELRGDLDHFPFIDGTDGLFQVTAKFNGVTLRYSPDWPEMNEVDGDLLFEGKRMLIQARRARMFGVALDNVRAEIPDLVTTWEEMLSIKGRGIGQTQDFLRFIEGSPVGERINHFTRDMRAEGSGTLHIGITMNLRNYEQTSVTGEYQFAGNRILLGPQLPTLNAAGARVQFTESALTVREGQALLFGAPVAIAAQTRPDGGVVIDGRGSVVAANLRSELGWPLLDHLSGSAAWRGSLTVKRDAAALAIESDLQGIASSLPEPFNKSAADMLPLRVERAEVEGDAAAHQLRVDLGRTLAMKLVRRRSSGGYLIERGGIGIGAPAPLAESGVALAVAARALDLDRWRGVFAGGGNGPGLPLDSIGLEVAELTAAGQRFSQVRLEGALRDGAWSGTLASSEAKGDWSWRAQEGGSLRARLRQLAVADVRGEAGDPAAAAAHADFKALPALDVVAEEFSLRGKPLGRLELRAQNRGGAWRIEQLAIANGDGKFNADGQWRPVGQGSVDLNFKLETGNAGKLLERLGYPEALRRTSAKLEGTIGWDGVPTSIDYPSLQGSFALEAKAGQFNKLDPGVGRLLGILSLQSLPRRITLDFRDVFSEGFAFDTIAGDLRIARGVLDARDLRIQGPAAKVKMNGQVDLARETQNLRVHVQPTLSESVALGAAIANPVAGVAAFVAQKVLKDPIEQMFSFNYAVTGGWSDPKVERIENLAFRQQDGR